MDHPLLQYEPPLFGDTARGASLPAPRAWRTGLPLRLADELELAAELLDAGTPRERDRVFCQLMRRVRGPGDTATCSALVRLLGPVADHVLPAWRADPAHPQRRVASERGARLLGYELEGLSPQDREFELARGLVRLGASAAQRALQLRAASPEPAARTALAGAARRFAPGLWASLTRMPPRRRRRPVVVQRITPPTDRRLHRA